MAWRLWLCDTTTGANRSRVNASATSWSRILNAGGSGQSSFPLRDPKVAAKITRASTLPIAKTLVLDWDGIVVYAGIIWTRKYARRTGMLDLQHQDVWSMLRYRHVVASNSDDVGDLVIDIPAPASPALSLASIAKTVVFEGQDAASTKYRLPIDFPADVAGTERRSYPGYNLTLVEDALRDLMETSGGPDVDFRPYWDEDGELRYEMRCGALTAGTWSWNVGAAKTDAHDITLTDDATSLAVNTFGIGQGMERDMLLRAGRNDASPYPVLERRITNKKVSDPAVMDALIDENLRFNAEPTQQWEFSILAGGKPSVSDLKLGGTVRQYHSGDPWIPDGWHDNRLIQFSGDLTDKVKLGFQPVGGA